MHFPLRKISRFTYQYIDPSTCSNEVPVSSEIQEKFPWLAGSSDTISMRKFRIRLWKNVICSFKEDEFQKDKLAGFYELCSIIILCFS